MASRTSIEQATQHYDIPHLSGLHTLDLPNFLVHRPNVYDLLHVQNARELGMSIVLHINEVYHSAEWLVSILILLAIPKSL